MPFNSWEFAVLITVTFFLYYICVKEIYQKLVATLASYIFFAHSQPSYLFILICSSGVNYYLARKIISGHKAALYLGLIFNLLLLGTFKYLPFLNQLWLAFSSFPIIPSYLLTLSLPLGISFFTFTAISLLVDTYTTSYGSDTNLSFLDVCFYIAFFPKLILGPITKKDYFFQQFNRKRVSGIDLPYVIEKLIVGFFLKMVIADNLHNQTFWIQNGYFETRSSIELLALLFGYSIQFFADFAGYSLIAIGVAGIFGYKLPDNFKFPYIATSVTEFWRRWHMTLSSFLKEYLYIPLGGNRKGQIRTYCNLLITMFLCGLWHGAGFNYILWGSLHGLALIAERPFMKSRGFRLPTNFVVRFLQWGVTFSFVSMGWIFFKLTDTETVFRYFGMILHNTEYLTDFSKVFIITCYALPVLMYHLLYLYFYAHDGRSSRSVAFARSLIRQGLLGVMLYLIVFNSGSGQPFVYFQF